MLILRRKLFLHLVIVFACDHFECISARFTSNGPRFRLANGTVLDDEATINIMHGNPVELFCTGDTNHLQVTKDHKDVPTTILNQTTIMIFEENLERNYYNYYCTNTKSRTETSVKVLVDSLPMISNFKCISENLEGMICEWVTDNIKCNTALYHVKQGVYFHLCNLEYEKSTVQGIAAPFCTWNYKHPVLKYELVHKTLYFLTKNCNALGCVNQTFLIYHLGVIKLGAPSNLEVIPKSSHVAVLQWRKPLLTGLNTKLIDSSGLSTKIALNYKIICFYSGIYHFQLNKTVVEDIFSNDKVGIELNMPCADTFYEIKVSVKLRTADEEFWSDDAITSFVTDPESKNIDTIVDSKCKHQRVKITSDVMLFEIDKFKSEMRIEHEALRDRIRSLTLKSDDIYLQTVSHGNFFK